MHSYVFSLLALPPTLPLHPTHLGHHRATDWAPCVIWQVPTIHFTRGSVYMSVLISQFTPPPSLPTLLCSQINVLYVWISIPALLIVLTSLFSEEGETLSGGSFAWSALFQIFVMWMYSYTLCALKKSKLFNSNFKKKKKKVRIIFESLQRSNLSI